MNILDEFQKRATAAGLTEEQVKSFVVENMPVEKIAEQQLDDAFASILAEACVEKTAETTVYLEGFLKQALDRGFSADEATQLSKVAVAAAFAATASTQQTPEENIYLQGMFEKAASMGLTEEQTAVILQKVAVVPKPPFGAAPKVSPPPSVRMRTAARPYANSATPGNASVPMPPGGSMPSNLSPPPITPPAAAAPTVAAQLTLLQKLLQALGIGSAAIAGVGGPTLAGYVAGRDQGAKGVKYEAGTTPPAGAKVEPDLMKKLQQLMVDYPTAGPATAGAGIGAALGGLTGLPEEKDPNDPNSGKSNVARNALIGSLLLGSAGGIAGHMNPDMFKTVAAKA